MQERQVTIGEKKHIPFPIRFLFWRRKNPLEQEGTLFSSPEAQLDRFMFKLKRRLSTETRRERRILDLIGDVRA